MLNFRYALLLIAALAVLVCRTAVSYGAQPAGPETGLGNTSSGTYKYYILASKTPPTVESKNDLFYGKDQTIYLRVRSKEDDQGFGNGADPTLRYTITREDATGGTVTMQGRAPDQYMLKFADTDGNPVEVPQQGTAFAQHTRIVGLSETAENRQAIFKITASQVLPNGSLNELAIMHMRVVLSSLQGMDYPGNCTDQQTIVVMNHVQGQTFALTCGNQSTANLDVGASAAQVQAALVAVLGNGNVTVAGGAGGPFIVSFAGNLDGMSVGSIVSTNANAKVVPTLTANWNPITVDVGLLWLANYPNNSKPFDWYMAGKVAQWETMGFRTPIDWPADQQAEDDSHFPRIQLCINLTDGNNTPEYGLALRSGFHPVCIGISDKIFKDEWKQQDLYAIVVHEETHTWQFEDALANPDTSLWPMLPMQDGNTWEHAMECRACTGELQAGIASQMSGLTADQVTATKCSWNLVEKELGYFLDSYNDTLTNYNNNLGDGTDPVALEKALKKELQIQFSTITKIFPDIVDQHVRFVYAGKTYDMSALAEKPPQ